MRRWTTPLLLFLATCGRAPAFREADPASLAPADASRLEQAKKAAGLLAERLLARLSAEVTTGGLAKSVDVCRAAAPEIAAEVARELSLRIGRTSHRLRNPDNRAPGWAAPVLSGRPEDAGRPRVFIADGGPMGVTRPIRTKAMCAACHGTPEQIDPAVRDRLAALYPADTATGFAEGDLRGLFWIEVPATRD